MGRPSAIDPVIVGGLAGFASRRFTAKDAADAAHNAPKRQLTPRIGQKYLANPCTPVMPALEISQVLRRFQCGRSGQGRRGSERLDDARLHGARLGRVLCQLMFQRQRHGSTQAPRIQLEKRNMIAQGRGLHDQTMYPINAPHNFIQAGWYSYGAMPGQKGSAGIDGHVDNGLSIQGPFKHLLDVAIGDKIEFDTATGAALYFNVVRTDIYKNADFPSENIFHDNSGALLKIITCYEHFIASEKTYDQRLVVTARLDPSQWAPDSAVLSVNRNE